MADLKTVTEELQEIDKALTNIVMGGQGYTLGSRKLTRADYSALVARKTELQAEMASADSSGLLGDTFVGVFEGR